MAFRPSAILGFCTRDAAGLLGALAAGVILGAGVAGAVRAHASCASPIFDAVSATVDGAPASALVSGAWAESQIEAEGVWFRAQAPAAHQAHEATFKRRP